MSPSVEKLSAQTIADVYPEGTRISSVIRAGTQGNDQVFSVISEHWKSTELGIEVLDKTTDPHIGETTRETKNITRAEPDPAFFQIPPDYTLQTSQQPSQDHP
jgi:hypothetical protein